MNPTRALLRVVAFALLLTALFSTASGQIEAKNWGKNTSGASLAFYEGPRQKSAQGTILTYNLIGKGFPAEVAYTLWQWKPDNEPKAVMQGVSFDKRGVLVCSGRQGFCKGDGPDDPINIKTTAVLGEPKRMAVVSPDGKIASFAEAIPFPIEASDKNCKLSVVRMDALAETVVARGSGFTPNESLTVTTQSNDEGATTKNNAGPEGDWTSVIIGAPKGQSKGKTSISVTGQSCKVAVSFAWGVGSNHPM